MPIQVISQHVVSRHPGNNKPKLVQVAYNNGRVEMIHMHNNGQITRSTLREGTTQIQRQPTTTIYNLNQTRSIQIVQPQVVRVVYQRVISRHSITNAPKIVETKYSNGKIIKMKSKST
jgi:hypothetical protein